MPAARIDDVRGVVYTPAAVARPMVELALGPLIADRSADELLALQVCDPALGEGAFLIEVAEVLARAVAAARGRHGGDGALAAARAEVAARCLAGIDLDARAVAVAEHRLGTPPGALRVGDALALAGPAAWPAAAARGGFDAVIGNPPYVRQESLGPRGKAGLRRFASYHGAADLYVYFIELAHALLRPGGRYCLITPNKWLTAEYARPLRALLAAQACVDGVVDLSAAQLFRGADAFPAIVWGTRAGSPARPILMARGGARALDEPAVAAALRTAAPAVERARCGPGPWHLDDPRDRQLLDRLERELPPLGAQLAARPGRGVVTGCNRAFLIDAATRARLLAADPAAAALIRPLTRGRDVRPWHARPPARWILLIDRGTDLTAHPAVLAHLARFRAALEPRPPDRAGPWSGRKPGAYRWYELQDPVGRFTAAREPRIFYQDIQASPACCFDPSGERVPDTTVWMVPSADRFLLAVLNSPLYGWYARHRFPPALGGAVRPKRSYLAQLPLPAPAPAARASIEALVEQRLDPALPAAAARELDAALADAVLAAYAITGPERAVLAR